MTYLHSPRPPLPEGAAPSEVNIPARREDSTAPKNLAQSSFFKKSKCAMLPEFLALKHESRFSDRVLGPCMWFLHVGTGWTLCCLAHGELAWPYHEPHTWLDDCLRMLLPCFRTRISVTHTTRDGEGGVGKAEKPHIYTHAWRAGGQWQQVHLQDGAASSRALSGFVGVHPELQWGKTPGKWRCLFAKLSILVSYVRHTCIVAKKFRVFFPPCLSRVSVAVGRVVCSD